jgi:hypothetical protein
MACSFKGSLILLPDVKYVLDDFVIVYHRDPKQRIMQFPARDVFHTTVSERSLDLEIQHVLGVLPGALTWADHSWNTCIHNEATRTAPHR